MEVAELRSLEQGTQLAHEDLVSSVDKDRGPLDDDFARLFDGGNGFGDQIE